jgi:hypothetical protein
MQKELTKEEILDVWGEPFLALCDNPRIGFTLDAILVELKKTPALKTIDGEETKVISITEPTFDQLKKIDLVKGDLEKSGVMVGLCGNLPNSQVNRIKTSDWMLLSRVVTCFFQESGQTGKTS